MKKIIMSFTLVLFICSLSAQSIVNLGPKVGFTSSTLPTDYTSVGQLQDNAKTGFVAGAFLRINIKNIYIQPEAYFAKKGGDIQGTNIPQYSNQQFSQQTVLNTMDVPLLLGMKLLNFKVVNLRVMSGPVVSFITSKNITYQVNGQSVVNIPGTSIDPNLKNSIWGVQLGAGIDILSFTIDARYEWGLNNVSNNPTVDTKSRLFHVSVGFKFL